MCAFACGVTREGDMLWMATGLLNLSRLCEFKPVFVTFSVSAVQQFSGSIRKRAGTIGSSIRKRAGSVDKPSSLRRNKTVDFEMTSSSRARNENAGANEGRKDKNPLCWKTSQVYQNPSVTLAKRLSGVQNPNNEIAVGIEGRDSSRNSVKPYLHVTSLFDSEEEMRREDFLADVMPDQRLAVAAFSCPQLTTLDEEQSLYNNSIDSQPDYLNREAVLIQSSDNNQLLKVTQGNTQSYDQYMNFKRNSNNPFLKVAPGNTQSQYLNFERNDNNQLLKVTPGSSQSQYINFERNGIKPLNCDSISFCSDSSAVGENASTEKQRQNGEARSAGGTPKKTVRDTMYDTVSNGSLLSPSSGEGSDCPILKPVQSGDDAVSGVFSQLQLAVDQLQCECASMSEKISLDSCDSVYSQHDEEDIAG